MPHIWPEAECLELLDGGPRNGFSPPASPNNGRVPRLSISAIRGGKVVPNGSVIYADVEDQEGQSDWLGLTSYDSFVPYLSPASADAP